MTLPLYNPWSILHCIKKGGTLKPYWVNTSDNGLIKELLLNSGIAFKERFGALMAGKSIDGLIDDNFVFADLKKNSEAAIWTLFLMTGYLKSIASQTTDWGVSYQLTIPNLEVRNVYKKIIAEWLANGYGLQWYIEFLQRLLGGNMTAFENDLTHILLKPNDAEQNAW